MPSVIIIPALAAVSTSHSEGHSGGQGSFYVYVVGYFEPIAPSVFYDGSTSPLHYGYSVNFYSDVITSTVVWADGVGICNTWGIHVDATAWVSPLTFPYTSGRGVEIWY
jgi:hypothetical protein